MNTSTAIMQVLPRPSKYFSHLPTSTAKGNICQSIIVLFSSRAKLGSLHSKSHIYLKSFRCTWKAFWNKHPQCSNCPGGKKLRSRLSAVWNTRRHNSRCLFFFLLKFALWSSKLLRIEVPATHISPVCTTSMGNKQPRGVKREERNQWAKPTTI